MDAMSELDATPTTARFHADVYDWLLHHGTVRCFYGTVDVGKLLHLAVCGIDLAASEPVGSGHIPTFSDTYSEPTDRDVLVGNATCRCGQNIALEHPPIATGDLIAAVAEHASAPPVAVADPPAGTITVSFHVEGGLVIGTVVPGPEGQPQISWRGGRGEQLDWASAVRLLGEPTIYP